MPLRLASAAGLVIGVGAIVLQFALSFPARLGQGDSFVGALLWFFTYFTILTNLMLVLIYLSVMWRARWLDWWRSPVTRGMMAGAIALVMGFYHFVLAETWAPEGLFRVADILLHYVTPAYYLIWWMFLEPKAGLSARNIPIMLVPPVVWLAWTMARGAILNEYPYPVLEAHVLGYPSVLTNIAGIFVILIVLFLGTIAIDRFAKRGARGG